MIPLDIAGNLLQNLNPMHAVVSTGTSARGLLVLLGLGMTITASGHQVFIGPSWEKDATPGYWFVVVIIMLLLFFLSFFTVYLFFIEVMWVTSGGLGISHPAKSSFRATRHVSSLL